MTKQNGKIDPSKGKMSNKDSKDNKNINLKFKCEFMQNFIINLMKN